MPVGTMSGFDTLTNEGSMMGSGGMIVMDEETCMVDVARYFTDFLTLESCGQCSACRLGLSSLYDILVRICDGKGQPDDLDGIILLLSDENRAGLITGSVYTVEGGQVVQSL